MEHFAHEGLEIARLLDGKSRREHAAQLFVLGDVADENYVVGILAGLTGGDGSTNKTPESSNGDTSGRKGVLFTRSLIQGAAVCAVWNVGSGTVSDLFEIQERGTALGWLQSGAIIGLILGPPLRTCRTLRAEFVPAPLKTLNPNSTLRQKVTAVLAGAKLGGTLSDREIRRSSARNNGTRRAEDRLRVIPYAMVPFSIAVLGLCWSMQYEVHVAMPLIFLAFAGVGYTQHYGRCIWSIMIFTSRASSINALVMLVCLIPI
ncbi:hypothetical protein M427DRAFT_31183 [Gonapodya prolifera JEL478]|uniref:MFS general substrate transporter n=1 Tax=Gonapodya prolifera (strain JEL478) TaxID=1344416 RepID=A0A139AIC8_GONPJ|nr:hypothetical protein M427DRAFT_31183 [Gonapodya prolifera JEL478]|eukprot:KXS16459.1 hypothetical protein M427DRAFT_31183 [Gonapodya prolifera JEL478]